MTHSRGPKSAEGPNLALASPCTCTLSLRSCILSHIVPSACSALSLFIPVNFCSTSKVQFRLPTDSLLLPPESGLRLPGLRL